MSSRVTETLLVTGYVSARLHVPDYVPLQTICAEASLLLPGGWRIEERITTCASLPLIRIVRVKRGIAPSLVIQGESEFIVSLDRDTICSIRLAFVTYTIMERWRQENHMTTAHACAASDERGNGILILGDKGSGKTNTLLALAETGCRALGDDLVVTRSASRSGLLVLPGKRTTNVREGCSTITKPFYEHKQARALGAHVLPDKAIRVTLVVRINVHFNNRPIVIQPLTLPNSVEILRLNENLCRFISGITTPLAMRKDCAFSPIYNIDCHRAVLTRMKMVKQLVRIPFHYVHAPTAPEAAGSILSLLTSAGI